MGEFAKWLLREEQKELFEYLYANVLNAVFLLLVALALWPLGKAGVALTLAKGYWVFWTVLILTASVLALLQRAFRMDLYSRFDAYVISGLAVSGFIQAGWSAFAALAVRDSAPQSSAWVAVILYALGALSCLVAFAVVSAFYTGHVYRFVNLPLALVSFVLFSVWPAAGRAVYGWFFDRAGRMMYGWLFDIF